MARFLEPHLFKQHLARANEVCHQGEEACPRLPGTSGSFNAVLFPAGI
jgi:hypothetical protein